MTKNEINIIKRRKHAAKSAFRFFTEVKTMYSPSIPTQVCKVHPQHHGGTSIEHHRIINDYRLRNSSITDAYRNPMRTGTGNCYEKAAICYVSFISNPRILYNSMVSVCNFWMA